MILIIMLICCSYSIGQSSSGIGVEAYPIGQAINGVVYLGNMNSYAINITPLDFQCDLMASCGLYPAGEGDIKTGASVYPTGQGDIKTYASVYPIGQIGDGAMVYLGR
jgi:hypothetical protein